MTIFRKVIGSVIAPLLVFTITLPATQAADITQNVQVKMAISFVPESAPIKQAVANRTVQRLATSRNIVRTGNKYVGKPYCRGGDGPRCFDCSGFTQFVYAKNGIELPRIAKSQLSDMRRVSRKNARPGDLVFFLSKHGYVYHVGIYIGNGKVLHSPRPHSKVRKEKIWSSRVVFATIR